MIIGLTGKNAAGKGEVAEYLKSKGYVYHSLSDALREEADKRGLEHTRHNLIELGNAMRREFGVGVLAEKINEKIADEKASGKTQFVVDSIRNPGEIEALRTNDDFKLVGVDTDEHIRYERLLKRGRVGDAKTFEEFHEHEQRENNDEAAGQQLDRCLEMADGVIQSNGTVDEANQDFERLVVERQWHA